MIRRIGEQVWDWMTDERPQYFLPSITGVTVIVFFILVMTVSWVSASYQIGVIEMTRANAVQACSSHEALRVYQSRASKNNDTILSWQTIRGYGFLGPILVSAQWDEVEFIAVPGVSCPEPS